MPAHNGKCRRHHIVKTTLDFASPLLARSMLSLALVCEGEAMLVYLEFVPALRFLPIR